MRTAIVCLLLLSSCAVPDCRRVNIVETRTIIEKQPVDHYIVIRDQPPPPHAEVRSEYTAALNAETPIVLKAGPKTIDCFAKLNEAAKVAFAPFEKPHHRVTAAEMQKERAALDALEAGEILQACPKN